MKLFACGNCNNTVYFENHTCLKCSYPLGFDPKTLSVVTLKASSETPNEFVDVKNKKSYYRYCQNVQYGVCNWLVPAEQEGALCKACELTSTIPAIYIPENLKNWQLIEIAKRRLVYSLIRLNLPLESKSVDPVGGLTFQFLAESVPGEVVTGHENGVITLNIKEANEVERTRHKLDLGENYRTVLGHLRHEIGHYYWDRLIMNSPFIQDYRNIFGDEQIDYATALQNYYSGTPMANWMDSYISMYATAHSWEDWAESFAHYLHVMDSLETAYSFGIEIDPKGINDSALETDVNRNPYETERFDRIVKMWIPLSNAMNSLNRSMGHQDFYPFVISPAIEKKLTFIHELCKKAKLAPKLEAAVGR